MALPQLPSDRAALEALAAELAIAEREVSAQIADVQAMLLLARQRSDPRFQCPEAQDHLAREFERLRPLVLRPSPVAPAICQHLELPSPEELHAMEPLATLQALRDELVRLYGHASAKLAEIPEASTATVEDPALKATLDVLAGSWRGIEIVRYLATRDGRRAHLDDIAVDVYRRRRCNAAAARKSIRTQIDRNEETLSLKGSPLRITIDDNEAYLSGGTDQLIRTIETT
jgi:hypothetical protein